MRAEVFLRSARRWGVIAATAIVLSGCGTAGEQYVARVRDYLNQRVWETPNFQQP